VVKIFLGRWCLVAGMMMSVAFASTTGAYAQKESNEYEKRNSWTVGVAAGQWDSTATRLAAELASVVSDGDALRVIPMITNGTDSNIFDLVYLRGVDVAIMQADALNRAKTEKTIAHVERRINYVVSLGASEIYVLAHSGIHSLEDLRGKTVSTDLVGSTANTSAKAIFDGLGISINPVNLSRAAAYDKLKAGEIDALVYVATAPDPFIAGIRENDNVVLLPIPNSDKFKDIYTPVSLKDSDFPNLVASGATIDTLSVPLVLAVFNYSEASDRNPRQHRFVDAFLKHFDELKKPPFHPLWKSVELMASVPGWTRYSAVQDYITKSQAPPPPTPAAFSDVNNDAATKILGQFFVFLAQREKSATKRSGDEDFDKIMKDFLVWRAAQK
jgi:TRAP transporter TAXI family solute receptor